LIQQSGNKAPVGVGDLPGRDDESGVAVLPAERNTLPSSFGERHGAQPGEKSEGVGSLPGKADELSVALLPEERKVEKRSASDSQSAVKEAEEPAKETEPTNPRGVVLDQTELQPNTVGADTAGDFIQSGTKPAAVDSSGVDKSTLMDAPESRANDISRTSNTNTTSADGNNNNSGKPGLMSKIKGEVKILQGKMTKNEDKMEEGRKLKSGN